MTNAQFVADRSSEEPAPEPARSQPKKKGKPRASQGKEKPPAQPSGEAYMQGLLVKAEAAVDGAVGAKTKKNYARHQELLLVWLKRNAPHTLTAECRDFLDSLDAGLTELQVRKKLNERFLQKKTVANRAVEFGEGKFGVTTIQQWVVSLEKRDGSEAGNSTYENCRSALNDLYRNWYPQGLTTEDKARMTLFFKGLKNAEAQRKAAGVGKVRVGKAPMSFSLYRQFAQSMLTAVKDTSFTRLFMILSWNLMCRAGNVATICYNHLEWEEDALVVWFAHTKNDQDGSTQREGRHIYANPFNPEICPILALGMFFALYAPTNADDENLFKGTKQYDRFLKALKGIMGDPIVAAKLDAAGLKPEEIGAHSQRKGASSFAASGSTNGPSAIAICLRAGWTLGNVQDRYIRVESAGDMHTGRTVAGLPHDSGDFGTLPPFFVADADQSLIQSTLTLCFPQAPQSLTKVLEFCLASLVYHHAYLRQTLKEDHSIFSFPVFRDQDLLERLAAMIQCRCGLPTDPIRGTGIPSHCVMLGEMSRLVKSHESMSNRLVETTESLKQSLVDGVVDALDDRAAAAGHITRQTLDEMLSNQFAELMAQLRPRVEQDGHEGVGGAAVPQCGAAATVAFLGGRLPSTSRRLQAPQRHSTSRVGRLGERKLSPPLSSTHDVARA